MLDLIKQYKINKLDRFNKFFSMFDLIEYKDIESILPEYYYDEFKELEFESLNIIDERDLDYGYVEIFNIKQKILNNLYNAKINLIVYKAFKEIEKNETLLSNLNSFQPIKGFSKPVKYNQNKTITGRLVTLKSSPSILTLPSKYRRIFKSRWDKGTIYQIDFKTLEPRVVRKINNKESSEDIYLEISDKFEFPVDRSVIKRAIISVLYGKTTQIEGLSKERSNIILEEVNNFFNIKSIFEKAKIIYTDECRRNFYGKPIWNIKEENKNKIVNNYIQSTAVDVSLLYFSELFDKFNKDLCKPIFIIHDALLCDVSECYKEEFFKIVSTGFNCKKLGYFPVEITDILENNNE